MATSSPDTVERFVSGQAPVMEDVLDRDALDDHQMVTEQSPVAPPPD